MPSTPASVSGPNTENGQVRRCRRSARRQQEERGDELRAVEPAERRADQVAAAGAVEIVRRGRRWRHSTARCCCRSVRPSSQISGFFQSGHQRRGSVRPRGRGCRARGASARKSSAATRPGTAHDQEIAAASFRRPAAAPAEWSAPGRSATPTIRPLVETAVASHDAVRSPGAHQRRQRRLHDGDAEAHQRRWRRRASRCRMRPPRAAAASAVISSPAIAIAIAPKRAISSEPGTAASANMTSGRPISSADLGLGHVQVVVDQRDDRRHRQERDARGNPREPEQREDLQRGPVVRPPSASVGDPSEAEPRGPRLRTGKIPGGEIPKPEPANPIICWIVAPWRVLHPQGHRYVTQPRDFSGGRGLARPPRSTEIP